MAFIKVGFQKSNPFSQALPFGQSFLSAAVRIGFLAVRRAVFCALRCGGRSVAGSMGAVR